MLVVAIVVAAFVLPALLKSKNREAQSRTEDRFSGGIRVLATQRSTRPVVADPLQTHRPQLLPVGAKGTGMKRPAIVDKRRAEKLAAFEELVAQRSARVASVNRWAAAYRYVFLVAAVALVGSVIASALTTWPWWSAAASAVVAAFSVVAARQLTDRWVEEDKDLRAEIAQARQEAGVITSPRGTVRVPVSAAAKANGSAGGAGVVGGAGAGAVGGAAGRLVLPAQARAVAGGSESLVEAPGFDADQDETVGAITAHAEAAQAAGTGEVVESVDGEAAGEIAATSAAAGAAQEAAAGVAEGAAAGVAEAPAAPEAAKAAEAAQVPVEGVKQAASRAARGGTRPAKRGWTPRPVPEPTYARQPRLTRRVANPYEAAAPTQRSARHEGTPVTAADLREVERTLNGAARLEAETAQMIENVLERRRAVG